MGALRIARQRKREHKQAMRRRALKRWLRARGISYPERAIYSEAALRKLVREWVVSKEEPAP